MKKKNILKRNLDFNRIIKSIQPYKYNNYILYIEYNTNEYYQFGFSIGKKIGNAVIRNRIKRQLKQILDGYTFKDGFNCIIIVRKGILSLNYQNMEQQLDIILKELNLIKEKKYETK